MRVGQQVFLENFLFFTDLSIKGDGEDKLFPESQVFVVQVVQLPVDDDGTDDQYDGNGKLENDQYLPHEAA